MCCFGFCYSCVSFSFFLSLSLALCVPATASVGAVNLITTACSAYLVDIMGRKVLLQVGTICMTVALGCLSLVLLSLNSAPTAQGVLAVLAVLLYVIGYAVGLGAVCWVVLSEIMSQRLRSKAFGLFVSINWGINLVIGLLTLLAIDGLGGTKDSMDDDEKDDAQKKGRTCVMHAMRYDTH